MNLFCFLLGIAIFGVADIRGQDVTQDYCNEELCLPEKLPHIACNHNNDFARSCPHDRNLIPMSTKRKNLLLIKHNRLRNKVALGRLEGYAQAKRMPILQWDEELAYLAELNVKTCKFAHDSCRNTMRYRFSGQNIGYYGHPMYYKPTADFIKVIMRGFFNEYKDANMTFIHQYQFTESGRPIGHFTQLVSDRTNRVGCALSRYTEWNEKYRLHMKTMLLACNYSYTNVYKEHVYETGPTASACVAGRHRVYQGLCSATEPIEPYKDFRCWWCPRIHQNRG